MTTLLIILASGPLSFIIGYCLGSLKKVKVETISESETILEDFDPLSLVRENKTLKRDCEVFEKGFKELRTSHKFLSSKFELLQKAARENNQSFIIYELQRMNYEEDKKPTIIAVSGFHTPISSFAYHAKEINNGYSTAIIYEKPQLSPNREEIYY